MESYYFHRFRDFNLDTLIKVLDSGFILPRAMMKNPPTDSRNIFNGNRWISLVQKTLMDDNMCRYFRSAYNELVPGNVCVVISPDIDGIKYTNYIDFNIGFTKEEREKAFYNDEEKERFSYYMDEVQTNIPIPINKLIAVGYPVSHFKINKTDTEISRDIQNIYSAIKRNGINIPILDSTSYNFADDEEQIKLSKIKK